MGSAALPPTEPPPLGDNEPDPLLGATIADRYRLDRLLGEGGMGRVYLGRHVVLEKPVAVKILAEDLARRPDLVQRFLQEAKAASKINHENVVDITDFGQTKSGTVFFVMELLEGRDLATLIRREAGPLPWPRAQKIVVQICRALAAAHDKGIIHRDMKPENVYLVDREGTSDFVKVLDFGIAKMTGLEESTGARLTRTGMIFGTPEYMSPEQAQGIAPDHRVDIYAVGVMLYEMLTGEVPFRAETFMGVLTKHMFEQPPTPSRTHPGLSLSPAFDAIILKALQKDREQRFQSMAELSQTVANTDWSSTPLSVPQAPSGPVPAQATPAPSGPVAQQASQPVPLAVATPSPAATPAPVVPAMPPLEPSAAMAVPRSRVGMVVALGVVLLLLLGGGLTAYHFLGATPPQISPMMDAAPRVPAPPPPPPAPPPPVRPRTVEIGLRSSPPGAEILQGEAVLGKTPTTLTLPQGEEEVALVLRLTGYRDKAIRVTPNRHRDFDLELAPIKKRRRVIRRPPPFPEVKVSRDPKPRDLKDPFAGE